MFSNNATGRGFVRRCPRFVLSFRLLDAADQEFELFDILVELLG
jgi:hypothetical protein